jgi:hypothetical protein
LFRADIALALDRASALDEAPQACKDNSSLVGLPFSSRSGPGMFPMRARNDARRGLSPALTGAFNVPPLYDARPFALSPPAGFFPSLRCHAGDLAIYFPLYFAVFFAMFLGCLTNCLPFALPAALALFVAAFSAGVKAFQAAEGR